MVIDVHEDSKIVEIWLDHRDQNDLQLSAKLRPLFADYNGKKYTQMDAEFVSVCSGGAAPGNFAAVAAKAAAAGVAPNVTAEDWEALDDADGELPF